MMSQFTSISPNQRLVLPYTRVKREVLLPNNLIGTVLVRVGQQVNPNTVIASGNRTTQHHVVNCAAELGLRRTAKLTDVLMVKLGDVVKQGEVLAGQQLQRGKRSFAPVDGQVVAIEDGTLIIRQIIDRVDLLAGMRGVVTDVRPGRGIEIEGSGALLQGVWGNNRRAVGSLRLEPERGIEMPPNEWRGTIMVTPHPVTAVTLVRMEQLRLAGLIAPSMDSTLLEVALQLEQAILLTEGFGQMSMHNVLQSRLARFEKRYATVHAVSPRSVVTRHPEVLIAVGATDEEVPLSESLASPEVSVGVAVRVIREPYHGQIGKIIEVGRHSSALSNGLSVPAAVVKFSNGRIEPIPMTNLEVFT